MIQSTTIWYHHWTIVPALHFLKRLSMIMNSVCVLMLWLDNISYALVPWQVCYWEQRLLFNIGYWATNLLTLVQPVKHSAPMRLFICPDLVTHCTSINTSLSRTYVCWLTYNVHLNQKITPVFKNKNISFHHSSSKCIIFYIYVLSVDITKAK